MKLSLSDNLQFLVFFIHFLAMLFRFMFSYRTALLFFISISFLSSSFAKEQLDLVWPTPSYHKFKTNNLAEWAQSTTSGKLISAQFGCVRNDGRKFHEAIDIKPYYNRRNGEATDPIFSIMEGRIAHISKTAGNSGYGRYIVIEHENEIPAVYSLYAHLSKIEPQLQIGQKVPAGYRIGTMGRSAGGYRIPKANAHLHLEIGLRMGSNFQAWYNKQGFGSKNHHRNYNGLNLTGFNPEAFYHFHQTGQMKNVIDFIHILPVSYRVRVGTNEIPDFIKRYPSLAPRNIKRGQLVGWEVGFTWYGLAKEWTPVYRRDYPGLKKGNVSLINYNPKALKQCGVRQTLKIKNSHPSLGKTGLNYIKLLFNFQ